jgi:hypothetical protein
MRKIGQSQMSPRPARRALLDHLKSNDLASSWRRRAGVERG